MRLRLHLGGLLALLATLPAQAVAGDEIQAELLAQLPRQWRELATAREAPEQLEAWVAVLTGRVTCLLFSLMLLLVLSVTAVTASSAESPAAETAAAETAAAETAAAETASAESPAAETAAAETAAAEPPAAETASAEPPAAEPPAAEVKEIVVVVHPSNPVATLSRDELLRIFKGEMTQWPDGKRIQVLEHLSSCPQHVAFHKVLYGSASEHRRPRGAAPLLFEPMEQESSAVVARLIAVMPNAVGYMWAEEAPTNLKIVARIGIGQ